jgi:tetratricopeptide (TPR) repeat protein
VLSTKSRYAMLASQNAEAIEAGRRALQMAEELGLDEIRAHALNNIGTSRQNMGDDGGIDDLEESIAISRALNSPEVLRAYTNLIACLSRDGRLEETERIREEALRIAEQFGHRGYQRWMEAGRRGALYSLGRWDDALAAADSFIEEAQRSPHYLESSIRAVRASIRIARGDDAGALDDSERALELGRSAKDPQALYPALLTRASVLVETGRTSAAATLFDEALADLPGLVAGIPIVGAALIACLALDVDRRDELRSVFDGAVGVRPATRELAVAILDGDFARAADIIGDRGERTLEASLRLRAAKAFAAEGQGAEADAQARAALAFYRSVTASRYEREAETLLRASA